MPKHIDYTLAARLYAKNISIQEIAKRMGLNRHDHLLKGMRARGFDIPPLGHGGGVKTKIDFEYVKLRYDLGVSINKISKDFGVAYSTLYEGMERRGMIVKEHKRCVSQQARRNHAS